MHSTKAGRIALVPIVAAAALVAACGGNDDDNGSPPVTAQQACAALAGKTIAGASVATAAEVPASGAAPSYCKVNARIEPSLNFEMRIPELWNGKLHYGGGGGFNGSIPPLDGANLAALSKGYVTVSSDSGHQASPIDATWAIGNPRAQELFESLSVPTVMSSVLEMVQTAYGTAPTRAYFEGCSNGGGEGLKAAQRYPNLFDGIIARAPVFNFTGQIGASNRNAKAALAPGASFTPAKVSLLSRAVLAACDANDGIVDGIVANPAACSFDAQVLRCAGGADSGDTCLSDPQLAVVTSWTTPATFVNNSYRAAGWPLTGNEDSPGNWDTWLLGPYGLQTLFQDSAIKGFIERDLTVNTLTYDYESNPAALYNWSSGVDGTNSDLRPFVASVGKLILWHGGTDPAVSNKTTSEYYQGVVSAMGGQAAADAFARYYIAPGVSHCAGGPGADSTDLLAALDAWVVSGTAPGDLLAAKLAADGSTDFARPLCRYPQYPRYSGPAGDATAAKLAGSYVCTAP